MSQPTLAQIPGILLRTSLRVLARLLFICASVLLLAGGALTLASILLATWKTPRGRRAELIVSLVLLATEFAKDRKRVTKTDSL